jgi:2-oxoisovalerate dehydrogenase E1 component
MSSFKSIKTETPWRRLEVTAADWKREDPVVLRRMMEHLFVVRRFEEKILEFHAAGLVHGPAHSSIGQDGGAVGAMSVLSSSDKINGTHRAHHQFLAKFLNHTSPDGYDPAEHDFTGTMQDMVMRSMAEIMGLSPGFCGGRGGSMHMRWDEAGVLGTNAIVGGNPPQAVGYAFADKLRKTGNISVAFFGDGSLQNGSAAESMNLAALFDCPVIFFLENNHYAVSTTVSESTRETRLGSRGQAFGVPTLEVDGMDVLAVRKAMQWAVEEIRTNRGPAFIVADTYRHFHQQSSAPGSAFGYRDKAEEDRWWKRDPVAVFPRQLIEHGVADQALIDAMDARARGAVELAASALTEPVPGANELQIIPSLWPDTAEVEYGIRGDGSELSDVRYREMEDFEPSAMEEVAYLDVIGPSLQRNMERDETVIALGEDIHRLRGGTFGGTRGALDEFPDRIFGMPISENGFVGLGLGASQNGLRPVVEIMYADFCLVAADQLFNQTGKVRHMFGGEHAVPMVLRSRAAVGSGYGSQHSMDASGLFAQYPGWRIVAPSTPFDYIGLMNTAVLSDDPVLVVEHQGLFATTGLIPVEDRDYCIPFGKARTVRAGAACTVIAWGVMVGHTLSAIETTGIDAEVIDLRTIDPMGVDWETVEASVRRTNRVLIAEQTTRGTTVAARLAHELQERCFDWLDHPVTRVTGANNSPVVSKVLEDAALANADDVATALAALTA